MDLVHPLCFFDIQLFALVYTIQNTYEIRGFYCNIFTQLSKGSPNDFLLLVGLSKAKELFLTGETTAAQGGVTAVYYRLETAVLQGLVTARSLGHGLDDNHD
jgi:hypothetical protein